MIMLRKSVAAILLSLLFSQAYGQSFEPEMIQVGKFSISKYEITQGQWKAVMGNNLSIFDKGDDYPVEMVSWIDAQEYIQKLNERTGKRYRLPTEDEWSLACHGAEPPQSYCGGEDIEALAWYGENSDGSTHPVGQKQPNSLGIYDMNGNVYEWTSDKHENGGRVIRGGNFTSGPGSTRIGRYNVTDYQRSEWFGFRVVRDEP